MATSDAAQGLSESWATLWESIADAQPDHTAVVIGDATMRWRDLDDTASRLATVLTERGVGVGSSERAVRAKVGHVRCETIFRFRSCHVGGFTPGRRVTDFLIEAGRVTRVSIGIVID